MIETKYTCDRCKKTIYDNGVYDIRPNTAFTLTVSLGIEHCQPVKTKLHICDSCLGDLGKFINPEQS